MDILKCLRMYLRQIFIRLHRHFLSSVSHDNTHKADEIDNAVSYFSEHYNEQINIDSYAEQNNISTSWFIRNFRLYTGITPKQFIMRKRIYNAEALLQNPQYNINEIARIVGYENPATPLWRHWPGSWRSCCPGWAGRQRR